MLPMSTPPNAIVFASGHIKIHHMIRAGIVMNIVSIIVITALTMTLVKYIFEIEPNEVPLWFSQ